MNGFGMSMPVIDTSWKQQFDPGYYQQPPVYSGTEPAPWATDTPALIPQVEAPVVAPPPTYFDWQAPLQTEGFNFPDDPVTAPPQISAPSPLIFDWEAPLDVSGLDFPVFAPPPPAVEYMPELNLEGLVFPGPVQSVPAMFETSEPVFFNWQDPLDVTGMTFPVAGIIEGQDVRTGPLESIGKFIGDVVGGVVDVGKFILDNLDIGVSYRGDFGGTQATKTYYKTLGTSAPTILGVPGGAAPTSVRTSVSTGAGGLAGGPPMTEDERLYREALGQTQADTTKLMIYAGGAYLAWVYLS